MTRRQVRQVAWGSGGIGLVGTVVGWITEPSQLPYAWLAAFNAWLAWPLGCLGLLLIHALTGGRWGYAIRPQLFSGVRTLWLVVPAAVPCMLALPELYVWARPGAAVHLANGFYLNRPFFFGRIGVYLVCWLGLSALSLRALQTEQPRAAPASTSMRETTSTPSATHAPDAALARIAPGGLIVLALTITFSAIDLTESLDPHFDSSVYGLITMAEMGLFALSVAVFAASLVIPAVSTDTLAVLGKLTLGLVLLCAYLDFMQLLIVWESDLPSEAAWYGARTSGGWGVTAALISAGHFVLPWCALIWPRVRRSRRGIAFVAGLLALSAIVRSWWLVLPASGGSFSPVDVSALVCLFGLGAALSLSDPRRPPLPSRDDLAAGDSHGG